MKPRQPPEERQKIKGKSYSLAALGFYLFTFYLPKEWCQIRQRRLEDERRVWIHAPSVMIMEGVLLFQSDISVHFSSSSRHFSLLWLQRCSSTLVCRCTPNRRLPRCR